MEEGVGRNEWKAPDDKVEGRVCETCWLEVSSARSSIPLGT